MGFPDKKIDSIGPWMHPPAEQLPLNFERLRKAIERVLDVLQLRVHSAVELAQRILRPGNTLKEGAQLLAAPAAGREQPQSARP